MTNFFMFLGINLPIYLYGNFFEFLGCEMHWETQNIEFIWGKNDARYIF